jgi:hypothetical protein
MSVKNYNTSNNNNNNSQATMAAAYQKQQQQQLQTQYFPTPFMDPATAAYMQMCWQMAAAAASSNPYAGQIPGAFDYSMAGMANPFQPNLNPYAAYFNSNNQRNAIPDDQQSMQSFHFDNTDNQRSKVNFANRGVAQSVAGDINHHHHQNQPAGSIAGEDLKSRQHQLDTNNEETATANNNTG